MKYPKQQFETLVDTLKVLSTHFELSSVHPCSLHYVVYQQASEGQKQNWLYCIEGGQLSRYHALTEEQKQTAIKWLNISPDFALYPEGCNDNHIETAVKNALKLLN